MIPYRYHTINKYMENILYVHHVLTGAPLPYIKCEIEDKIVKLLKQIEQVLVLAIQRCNSQEQLSYHYYFVVIKFLDLLRQPKLWPGILLLNMNVLY